MSDDNSDLLNRRNLLIGAGLAGTAGLGAGGTVLYRELKDEQTAETAGENPPEPDSDTDSEVEYPHRDGGTDHERERWWLALDGIVTDISANSDKSLIVGLSTEEVAALERASGDVVFRHGLSREPPALASDGDVIFVCRRAETDIDAVSIGSQERVWRLPTDLRVNRLQDPTTTDERLLVNTRWELVDGEFHSALAVTDAESKADRWIREFPETDLTDPVVRDGSVLVGDGTLHSFDLSAGDLKWEAAYDVTHDESETPAVAATRDVAFVLGPDLVEAFQRPPAEIQGVDPEETDYADREDLYEAADITVGEKLWSRSIDDFSPEDVRSSFQAGVTTEDLYVIVINELGRTIVRAVHPEDGYGAWWTDLDLAEIAAVERAGSSIYIARAPLRETTESSVVALDATTGEEQWRVPLSDPPLAMTVDEDSIYVVLDRSGPQRALTAIER